MRGEGRGVRGEDIFLFYVSESRKANTVGCVTNVLIHLIITASG